MRTQELVKVKVYNQPESRRQWVWSGRPLRTTTTTKDEGERLF